jgi:chorismate synthase
MSALRYITSGESHGKALVGILEGMPSGLSLSSGDIDRDLKRRQGGYGRGGRMKIESDHAEILSGVRWGKTIGSPIALMIVNKDFQNWSAGMSSDMSGAGSIPAVTRPRPGHADLAGTIKYDHRDIRNILERSSARETAMRVALGAAARKFLAEFRITVGSYVTQIGSMLSHRAGIVTQDAKSLLAALRKAEQSPVRCPDEAASKKMVKLIDKAMKEGNSLGGIFEVFVAGVPIGLGSHVQWDRKLDGRLAQAVMSIQAIKGVEAGLGFEMGMRSGSEVMDEIFYVPEKSLPVKKGRKGVFLRRTNNAGGVEGGMSNGMPIILRAAMKPIPTLRRPLRSVDMNAKKPVQAAYERSDICAVPAASVIGEAMVALTIADAFLEKFGGDSIEEVTRNYNAYIEYVSNF